jgi:hypothetical protein
VRIEHQNLQAGIAVKGRQKRDNDCRRKMRLR